MKEGRVDFPETQWSLVLAAGDRQTAASECALEELCRAYWNPLYAFVRRSGYPPDEAADLTQEFFTRLLEKNPIRQATRERGRFRSFLLASMKHFISNEWDRQRALKRGGGYQLVSIDLEYAEAGIAGLAADTLPPDRVFERQWAIVLLERVLTRLESEYAARGTTRLFERLKSFITHDDTRVQYKQLTDELGITEGALRIAVHRLRSRYRDVLKAEIASTVNDASEVDDELRFLLTALSS